MKNVYLLTENGNGFIKEGHDYIKNLLKDELNETDDLKISEGLMLNVSEFLLNELNKHPDCYVAISSDESFKIVYDDNIDKFKAALSDHPELTSWETAVSIGKRTLNQTLNV